MRSHVGAEACGKVMWDQLRNDSILWEGPHMEKGQRVTSEEQQTENVKN